MRLNLTSNSNQLQLCQSDRLGPEGSARLVPVIISCTVREKGRDPLANEKKQN